MLQQQIETLIATDKISFISTPAAPHNTSRVLEQFIVRYMYSDSSSVFAIPPSKQTMICWFKWWFLHICFILS